MSKINKRKVVIASVLKPVDDTRMFEKIGLSLANTHQYEVHIIGFPSGASKISPVEFHPLPSFTRLSLKRLFASWKVFKKILSLKPSLLIITTHELLRVAVVTKLLTGCKVIYDVQENYYRNILYLGAFPKLLSPVIAFYVRVKEVLLSGFIDHFLLAERGYEKEMRFTGKRKTILENKSKRPTDLRPVLKKTDNSIRLLFSGTLAETTGVFKAVSLATELHRLDPRITLELIGYCSKKETLVKLKELIAPHPFITLTGGDVLVPHEKIQKSIQRADFGMILYEIDPSTENSIPTKLYEYLGARLPVLLIDHSPWIKMCDQYNAAIPVQNKHLDIPALYHAMLHQQFYTSLPEDVYWESEEEKLIRLVESL